MIKRRDALKYIVKIVKKSIEITKLSANNAQKLILSFQNFNTVSRNVFWSQIVSEAISTQHEVAVIIK